MHPGNDLSSPRWGPGFLRLNAWAYRVEYAAAIVAILLILFVWRLAIEHALSTTDILLVVFWAVWPDLVAFVPIGLASRRSRVWPSWGSPLYNLVHSLLVWAIVFGAVGVLFRAINWPLLGWAGHVAADRAFGYYLRAPSRGQPS